MGLFPFCVLCVLVALGYIVGEGVTSLVWVFKIRE